MQPSMHLTMLIDVYVTCTCTHKHTFVCTCMYNTCNFWCKLTTKITFWHQHLLNHVLSIVWINGQLFFPNWTCSVSVNYSEKGEDNKGYRFVTEYSKLILLKKAIHKMANMMVGSSSNMHTFKHVWRWCENYQKKLMIILSCL